VIPRNPRPVYEQSIHGQFYQEELTPVSVSKETVIKIDKIIGTRGRDMALRSTTSDGWVMVQSSTVGSKRPTLRNFFNYNMKVDRDKFYFTLFSNASTEIYINLEFANLIHESSRTSSRPGFFFRLGGWTR